MLRSLCMAAVLAATPSAFAADAAGKGKTGKEVYDAVCSACHQAGVLGAPKFGDATAWKKLIAEGVDALTKEAIKGVRQMPPRGGNPSLSDIEVRRAVVHMANAAGGKFSEPR